MKIIICTVFASLAILSYFGNPALAECDNCNEQTSAEASSQSNATVIMPGNNGDNGPKGPTPHFDADAYFPFPGALNYEAMKWNIDQEATVVPVTDLLSKEELKKWLPRIKWSGRSMMPRRSIDRMYPVTWPLSMNDIQCITVEMEMPNHSMAVSPRIILLSFNYHFVHSQRYVPKIFPLPEAWVGGAATGGGSTVTHAISGSTGIAGGVAPTFGFSKTGTNWPFKYKIALLNDGPVYDRDPMAAYRQKYQTDRPSPPPIASLPKKKVVAQIYFDTDKHNIRLSEKWKISAAAKEIHNRWPDLNGKKILIAGHTDYRASEDHNRELSDNRANTVRNEIIAELVAQGVPKEEARQIVLITYSGKTYADPALKHDDRKVVIYEAEEITQKLGRNTEK